MTKIEMQRTWDAPKKALPRHVAIIMDGNGRWAAERGLPRAIGHRKGVEAVRRTVKAAIELKVKTLTLYSFSSENWSRPPAEIDDLMGLIRLFIEQDVKELNRQNVRLLRIGERERVAPDLLRLIDEGVERTAKNTALDLVIAFNYGSRGEIVRAARQLVEAACEGRLKAGDVTEQSFAAALDTHGIPDPDLLIRTSGELRLSNFLLWQLAYAEFVFQDVFWPDYDRETLAAAIAEYQGRERRYGGVSAKRA